VLENKLSSGQEKERNKEVNHLIRKVKNLKKKQKRNKNLITHLLLYLIWLLFLQNRELYSNSVVVQLKKEKLKSIGNLNTQLEKTNQNLFILEIQFYEEILLIPHYSLILSHYSLCINGKKLLIKLCKIRC